MVERDDRQIFAIVRDGRMVSSCWSVRENVQAGECYVFTEPEYRRRGYARQTVVAWACSLQAMNKLPFYSHEENNTASWAVAKALKLIPCFEVVSYNQEWRGRAKRGWSGSDRSRFAPVNQQLSTFHLPGGPILNTETMLQRLETDNIDHFWPIYHDYNGRAGAKTVPKARFAGTIEKGIVFARANLNFTTEDHQAEGAAFLADSGDFMAVPDPSSYTVLPYRKNTAQAHVFMRQDDGSPWDGCPRTRLQTMVERLAAAGFSAQVALEPEFTLFRSDGEGGYVPVDHDGMFSVDGLDRHYDFLHTLVETLGQMGIEMQQLGKEYGPGQYEGSTRHAPPIRAVDNYLIYTQVVRALARDAGMVATFMPKPYAHLPGNGLHVHLSLWDKEGKQDLTCGENDDVALSTLGKQFVAGLLDHARALSGIGACIVNSYKRLLPGSWAPAHICWGVGNRAALVRVPGLGARRHLEFRSGDNSANPYFYVTALLAAGLDGIERQLDAGAPVDADVGHFSAEEAAAQGIQFLPRTLPEALDAVEADAAIMDALGPIIGPEFLKVKRTELAAYNLEVHPWERNTYLETL